MNDEIKNNSPENEETALPSAESEPLTQENPNEITAEPAEEIQQESAPQPEAPNVNTAPQPTPERAPQFQLPLQPIIRTENPYTQQSYTNQPVNQQPVRPRAVAPTPPAKPKKKRKGLVVFFIILAVAVVFAFGVLTASLFGMIFSDNSGTDNENNNNSSYSENGDGFAMDNEGAPELNILETPSSSSTPVTESGALTTSQIAAKVKPSIVGIVVYSKYNSSTSAGEGTGVVMGEDSTGKYTYIVTCAHVISDSNINVTVQTENGTSYEAVIVGLDTRTDLGVLRITASGLPAAEFGNSDALQVGDSVYAIGNPGGVEFFGSFTGGFVSAIDRPVSSEIGYTMKCIQHDAAINPGNSGGALVNVYGQVIGINSQKIAATDYEGMGFAIPITSAKEIIDNLIAYNYVPNRPKLGITYYPVSASSQYNMIARVHGLPSGTLIIDTISEDSSLANTNVRQYDMITAVNGEPLTTADILLEKIDNGKVGDKFKLTICRVKSDYSLEEFEVEITLVEDKGNSSTSSSEETTEYYVDPFEFYGY